MTADPRPLKRHKADIDEWKILRKLKLGPCRVCGHYAFAYPNQMVVGLHHLIPKSVGGSDVPDNLVPLCGSGTTGCHGAVEARSPVACSLLRESLTLKELAHILTNKSEFWLDRRYPRVEVAV